MTKMKRYMRGALRSKSVWLSSLVMFFGGLEMYYPYLEKNIDPKYYGPIFFGIGMTGIILRVITKKSLEDK